MGGGVGGGVKGSGIRAQVMPVTSSIFITILSFDLQV